MRSKYINPYIVALLILLIPIWNVSVPIKYKFVLMKFKSLSLGTINVDEITIAEWKPLFSLKTFYFCPGEAQEIYHTHSFDSYSFLVYGNYIEAFYDDVNDIYWEEPRNRSRLIHIPRDRYHQITKSDGCRTIMITGPWSDHYKEYKKDTKEVLISTHGRVLTQLNKI